MADIYKRPTAIFFLSEPPAEETLQQKFRSLPDQYVKEMPPKIRFLARLAKVRQLELAELLNGRQPSKLVSLNRLRQGGIQNITKVAARARSLLGISLQEQKSWKSYDIAFEEWRDKLTLHGLWVFKASFGKECKNYDGFFLQDEKFPVIYINNNKSKRRQIFTLFHEVGHYILSKGGISFRDNLEQKLRGTYLQDEVYCNAFAGAFLVPDEDLGFSRMPSGMEIMNLAETYKVSEEVILRKCLNMKLISQDQYKQKTSKSNKDESARERGGGDFYRNQKIYLGVRYMELAFDQFYQQQISEPALAEYLGVSESQLPSLEKTIS